MFHLMKLFLVRFSFSARSFGRDGLLIMILSAFHLWNESEYLPYGTVIDVKTQGIDE